MYSRKGESEYYPIVDENDGVGKKKRTALIVITFLVLVAIVVALVIALPLVFRSNNSGVPSSSSSFSSVAKSSSRDAFDDSCFNCHQYVDQRLPISVSDLQSRSFDRATFRRFDFPFCNAGSYSQIPGTNLVVGRRVLGSGDDCRNSKSWRLWLGRIEAGPRIVFVRDVLVPARAIGNMRVVTTAYDPSVALINGELWVTFEVTLFFLV